MKALFLRILLIINLFFLFNCTTQNQNIKKTVRAEYVGRKYYWPTLKILPPTKEEAKKIDSLRFQLEKYLEENNKGNIVVLSDPTYREIEFTGTKGFIHLINEKLILHPKIKLGENIVRITVGKKDCINEIYVRKYTDKYTKKQIEKLFKLPELNEWKSGTNYGVPLETQFEIRIFIEQLKI